MNRLDTPLMIQEVKNRTEIGQEIKQIAEAVRMFHAYHQTVRQALRESLVFLGCSLALNIFAIFLLWF